MPSIRIALSCAALVTAFAGIAVAQNTASAGAAVTVTAVADGQRAPEFSLPWANKDSMATGAMFSLKDAGKPVVIAFYPKDFTSGCTAQMKTFTEQYADLFGPDVTVVGISTDSLETHQRFAKDLKLPFRLLSDPDQRVAKLYESAGGRGYNKRTVFVVDRSGNIVYRNMQFGAIDPTAYAELKKAVALAKK